MATKTGATNYLVVTRYILSYEQHDVSDSIGGLKMIKRIKTDGPFFFVRRAVLSGDHQRPDRRIWKELIFRRYYFFTVRIMIVHEYNSRTSKS